MPVDSGGLPALKQEPPVRRGRPRARGTADFPNKLTAPPLRDARQRATETEPFMTAFWCAVRLVSRREALATHCLGLAGFEVYLPRLRERRIIRGGARSRSIPRYFPATASC